MLPRASTALLALPFALPLVLAGCDKGDDSSDDHAHSHETGDTGEQPADCTAETRDDEFMIGLSKTGTTATVTLVAADPVPPILGDNSWTLAITDAGGEPITDAQITTVMPMMPDHGHGTSVAAEVTATDNPAEFVVSPVNLFMAGLWEITLDLDLGDGATDQVVFAFCVE